MTRNATDSVIAAAHKLCDEEQYGAANRLAAVATELLSSKEASKPLQNALYALHERIWEGRRAQRLYGALRAPEGVSQVDHLDSLIDGVSDPMAVKGDTGGPR